MAGVGVGFLRQLSLVARDQGAAGASVKGVGSRRWSTSAAAMARDGARVRKEIEGVMMQGIGGGGAGMVMKKRVVVVIDHTSRAKHAMMWALTHVTNKGDLLTLLHVVPAPAGLGRRDGVRDYYSSASSAAASNDQQSHTPQLANSLGALCKACKPEAGHLKNRSSWTSTTYTFSPLTVEIEALVIQGPKLATVLNQVKKLEAAVLVLAQKDPSPFCCFFGSRDEDFVEQCVNKADCLTLAVRKQSGGVGGYLVSTRWQKNFWLLA